MVVLCQESTGKRLILHSILLIHPNLFYHIQSLFYEGRWPGAEAFAVSSGQKGEQGLGPGGVAFVKATCLRKRLKSHGQQLLQYSTRATSSYKPKCMTASR